MVMGNNVTRTGNKTMTTAQTAEIAACVMYLFNLSDANHKFVKTEADGFFDAGWRVIRLRDNETVGGGPTIEAAYENAESLYR